MKELLKKIAKNAKQMSSFKDVEEQEILKTLNAWYRSLDRNKKKEYIKLSRYLGDEEVAYVIARSIVVPDDDEEERIDPPPILPPEPEQTDPESKETEMTAQEAAEFVDKANKKPEYSIDKLRVKIESEQKPEAKPFFAELYSGEKPQYKAQFETEKADRTKTIYKFSFMPALYGQSWASKDSEAELLRLTISAEDAEQAFAGQKEIELNLNQGDEGYEYTLVSADSVPSTEEEPAETDFGEIGSYLSSLVDKEYTTFNLRRNEVYLDKHNPGGGDHQIILKAWYLLPIGKPRIANSLKFQDDDKNEKEKEGIAQEFSNALAKGGVQNKALKAGRGGRVATAKENIIKIFYEIGTKREKQSTVIMVQNMIELKSVLEHRPRELNEFEAIKRDYLGDKVYYVKSDGMFEIDGGRLDAIILIPAGVKTEDLTAEQIKNKYLLSRDNLGGALQDDFAEYFTLSPSPHEASEAAVMGALYYEDKQKDTMEVQPFVIDIDEGEEKVRPANIKNELDRYLTAEKPEAQAALEERINKLVEVLKPYLLKKILRRKKI